MGRNGPVNCGHQCCEIPSNRYHTHAGPPAHCPRCARTGGHEGPVTVTLGRILADVLARVAPQIPGLPTDEELTDLVASHTMTVYATGLIDPDVQRLDEREQRTVLAGRVGMELAFPSA